MGIMDQEAIVKWCHGEANLADGLTKETARTQLDNFYSGGCMWSLVYGKDGERTEAAQEVPTTVG